VASGRNLGECEEVGHDEWLNVANHGIAHTDVYAKQLEFAGIEATVHRYSDSNSLAHHLLGAQLELEPVTQLKPCRVSQSPMGVLPGLTKQHVDVLGIPSALVKTILQRCPKRTA
jgi:hypothetical protein